MIDGRLTLMAVHAHPDDEATGTGGVLAKAAAEGIRTVLVTCTDGRCGDGPDGVKPGEPGHDPEKVVELRRQELEKSCAVLNVSHLELLEYADSGMMGWVTNDAPGSFWNTPVDEAASRLADLIRQYQPDVVVTYDENGFYGHPDHIQAHRITMAAVAATELPAKVYWTTAPKSKMAEFAAIMRELGADWDVPAGDAAEGAAAGSAEGAADEGAEGAGEGAAGEGDQLPAIGLPDEQITTWVDITEFAGQKYDALAAHASQNENIFFLRMGPERFSELMGVETFVRVQDRTGAPAHETDLFAGLR